MTQSQTTLQWKAGRGWLVFSSHSDSVSSVRADTYQKVLVEGPSVYISLRDDGGDSLLDDMQDLGVQAGYIVDPTLLSAEELVEQVKEASLVVVESGDSVDAAIGLFDSAMQYGLEEAYRRGAVLLIEGMAVNLFGELAITDSGAPVEGMAWLPGTYIEPETFGGDSSRPVQTVLRQYPQVSAITIGPRSALALGPSGQAGVLGDEQVAITFNRPATTGSDAG